MKDFKAYRKAELYKQRNLLTILLKTKAPKFSIEKQRLAITRLLMAEDFDHYTQLLGVAKHLNKGMKR